MANGLLDLALAKQRISKIVKGPSILRFDLKGFLKGYALCQRLKGVDCLIVDKEGKIILSPGLKNRISFIPFR
jgi:thiamine biosynthesis lipoprotein ApbE